MLRTYIQDTSLAALVPLLGYCSFNCIFPYTIWLHDDPLLDSLASFCRSLVGEVSFSTELIDHTI